MGSIRKTFHDDIYVIGDIIGQALNVTSAIVSTTLYVGGAVTLNNTLTVAGAAVFNGNVDINAQFEVHDSTSEITFQHGIFRVSLVGGTTLFRLTDLDGGDINNDFKLSVGKTLYVDNILRSDTGLGTLDIEGIGFDGGWLYTDNIGERTGGNGIRIDQLKIKDNTVDLVSGTEIIFEKQVRIRDPLYLEVTNIREADLSSGVHIDGNVYLSYTDTYTRILRMIGDGKLGGTTAVYSIFDNDSTPASTSITLVAFDCEVLHLDLIVNVGGGGITRTYNVELDNFEAFNCPRTFSIITESDNTPLASGSMVVNFRSSNNNIIATFTNGTITKKYYETQLAWLGTAWAVVSNAETTALVT